MIANLRSIDEFERVATGARDDILNANVPVPAFLSNISTDDLISRLNIDSHSLVALDCSQLLFLVSRRSRFASLPQLDSVDGSSEARRTYRL